MDERRAKRKDKNQTRETKSKEEGTGQVCLAKIEEKRGKILHLRVFWTIQLMK